MRNDAERQQTADEMDHSDSMSAPFTFCVAAPLQ
jgi:hypothetical protein